MRSTNVYRSVALVALALGAVTASTADAGSPPRLPAYGIDRIEGSTRAALQVAYDNERNARKDYEIFARVADREGHPRVATLFRAIATGEETHAAHHADNLVILGAEPEWEPKSVVVGTTADNLLRSIGTERGERDAVYLVFAEFAQLEGLYDFRWRFSLTGKAEETHADMFREALDALENEPRRPTLLASRVPLVISASAPGPVAVICADCGSAFHGLPEGKCPTCGAPNTKMRIFI